MEFYVKNLRLFNDYLVIAKKKGKTFKSFIFIVLHIMIHNFCAVCFHLSFGIYELYGMAIIKFLLSGQQIHGHLNGALFNKKSWGQLELQITYNKSVMNSSPRCS